MNSIEDIAKMAIEEVGAELKELENSRISTKVCGQGGAYLSRILAQDASHHSYPLSRFLRRAFAGSQRPCKYIQSSLLSRFHHYY